MLAPDWDTETSSPTSETTMDSWAFSLETAAVALSRQSMQAARFISSVSLESPDYCRHTVVVCTYMGKTKVLRSWCVHVCVCVLFPPIMTDLIVTFNVYTNNCYHPPKKKL